MKDLLLLLPLTPQKAAFAFERQQSTSVYIYVSPVSLWGERTLSWRLTLSDPCTQAVLMKQTCAAYLIKIIVSRIHLQPWARIGVPFENLKTNAESLLLCGETSLNFPQTEPTRVFMLIPSSQWAPILISHCLRIPVALWGKHAVQQDTSVGYTARLLSSVLCCYWPTPIASSTLFSVLQYYCE